MGEREPQWQDALGVRPEILVSLRPKALRRDRIYGPLVRLALGVARERSRVVAGTRVLEAMEDADEVIASITAVETSDLELSPTAETDSNGAGDIVAIVRGVRADLDPGALVDPEGHPLWSPGPNGRVRELVHERDPDGTRNPASLFELPGRTWVIASGAARVRARDAFARPLGRAEPVLDPDVLALVRLDGPSLVAHIPALRPSGALAFVGSGLQALELELAPGVDREVRAVISYANAGAAAASERVLRELQDTVVRKKPPALAWLAAATIERPLAAGEDASVRVIAPLPPELIEDWVRAGTDRTSHLGENQVQVRRHAPGSPGEGDERNVGIADGG